MLESATAPPATSGMGTQGEEGAAPGCVKRGAWPGAPGFRARPWEPAIPPPAATQRGEERGAGKGDTSSIVVSGCRNGSRASTSIAPASKEERPGSLPAVVWEARVVVGLSWRAGGSMRAEMGGGSGSGDERVAMAVGSGEVGAQALRRSGDVGDLPLASKSRNLT